MSDNGKNSEKKKKIKKKVKNTNLHLVKNNDLPVGKLPAKKKKAKKEKGFLEDRQGVPDWFVQHKSLVTIGLTVFILMVLILLGGYYIIKTYTVTTVYVDGNIHYTNEEVMDMVMTEKTYANNSLYLAMKYKDKGIEGIPFVEKMDINILSPNTIRINVYEKALAGYVEYLGQYMYFDKDGIVVESADVRTSGVPQVTGLKFDYVVLHEPLPVENNEIFMKILSITQLLAKYDLSSDKIFFDSAYDLTLYFNGIKVTLGSSEKIDEKIMVLQSILPKLEGKKGTLQMENYTENTENITFIQD